MDELSKIDIVSIIIGLSLLFGLGIAVGGAIEDLTTDIELSHETADVICQKLTGNETAIAKDYGDFFNEEKPIEEGELYCQLPSYDSTQKIKVGVGN